MISRVGLTKMVIVVIVLAAGVISYTLIQYGRSTQQTETERRLNENYIDTRQRIDRAIRSVPPAATDDEHLEWLLQRQRRAE